MSRLNQLAVDANSLYLKDMMIKLFEMDNEKDFKLISDTYEMCNALNARSKVRREQLLELQMLDPRTLLLSDSIKVLADLQNEELEKARQLMKLVLETQIMVLKKNSFIAHLHRQWCICEG